MSLDSITFWINAFIPNSVCDKKGDTYAITVPAPLPRYFAGDQREFSDDIAASARMHSEVTIVGLAGDSPSIDSERQVCGTSTEVDSDGNVLATATAATDRMHFFNLRGSQTTDPNGGVIDGIPGSVQIDVAGSAALPLLAMAPDIDYSGTLIIDRAEGNVLFKGAANHFPAFEMYFKANDGPTAMLAQISPVSPIDLMGEEDSKIDVSARIVLADAASGG